VQIRESVLGSACIESVQSLLFAACAPAVSPLLYVDHLDTVAGSVSFSGAEGSIAISLDIAVYVVSESDIEAHPNAMPKGALAPLGRLGVSLTLAMVGTALQIVSAASDPSTLTPAALQSTVKAILDAALSTLAGTTIIDAAPVASALSALVPVNPDLRRGDGVIAIRFGGSGPAVSRLAAGQDWGATLDASDATGLLTQRLPAGLPVNVRWLPNGATPGIGADVGVDISALGIDVASINATANGAISLAAPSSLDMSVTWDLDLSGLIGPFEPLARRMAREYLRNLVRNHVPGAAPAGAQGFSYAIALPTLPMFLRVRPVWGGISSDKNGMTIGGPVIAAFKGQREILSATPTRFGKPTWWGHCRERARSGDGSPPSHVDPASLKVVGGASFSDAGAFCGATIEPPNQWLAPFLTASVDGIGFRLPLDVAELIASDVRIVARTARGVRFFNLGKPVIVRDEEGVIEAQINWFDDCLYLTGAWLKLATGQALTVGDFTPVPLEHPDWMAELGAEIGLNSHLITISGLEPGEIVSFRGAGLALDVSAGREGVAILPAMIGAGSAMRDAYVQRLSRRPFSGRIAVHTVEFTWLASIGEAEAASVRDIHGAARVAWRNGGADHVAEHRPGRDGAFAPIHGHEETSLNPQPLPPGPPESARLAEAAGLGRGVSAYSLAGVDERRVAVAAVGGGEAVLLVHEEGHARVAGRYAGPLVGMAIDGNFALSKSGGNVHLFRVRRPETTIVQESASQPPDDTGFSE